VRFQSRSIGIGKINVAMMNRISNNPISKPDLSGSRTKLNAPLKPEFAVSSFLTNIIIEQNPVFAEVTILIKNLCLILKATISKVKKKLCFVRTAYPELYFHKEIDQGFFVGIWASTALRHSSRLLRSSSAFSGIFLERSFCSPMSSLRSYSSI